MESGPAIRFWSLVGRVRIPGAHKEKLAARELAKLVDVNKSSENGPQDPRAAKMEPCGCVWVHGWAGGGSRASEHARKVWQHGLHRQRTKSLRRWWVRGGVPYPRIGTAVPCIHLREARVDCDVFAEVAFGSVAGSTTASPPRPSALPRSSSRGVPQAISASLRAHLVRLCKDGFVWISIKNAPKVDAPWPNCAAHEGRGRLVAVMTRLVIVAPHPT